MTEEEYKRGDLAYCTQDDFGDIGFYGKDLKLTEMNWSQVGKIGKTESEIIQYLTSEGQKYKITQREGIWEKDEKGENSSFLFRVCPKENICDKCNWIPVTNVEQSW